MTELLTEALTIMTAGMVTVFAFLTLLLAAMYALRKLTTTDSISAKAQTPLPSDAAATPQQLAAISAAIHQYRDHSNNSR